MWQQDPDGRVSHPFEPVPLERDFVLGVDLDGVCADYYNAARPIAAEWLGVDVDSLTTTPTYGLLEWGLDRKGGYTVFHQHLLDNDFFREVPEISGAAASLKRISDTGVRIRIITHRLIITGNHRESVAQTVDWLEARGIPYWDLCFVKDKAAVGADLYIEDTDRNIAALRQRRLRTVVFTNSTNLDVPGARADSWDEAEAWVVEEVERWRKLTAPLSVEQTA